MPSLAEEACTESEQGLSAISGPTHASLFHTLLNQGSGSGFDGAAVDRESGIAIGSVVPVLKVCIVLSVRVFQLIPIF